MILPSPDDPAADSGADPVTPTAAPAAEPPPAAQTVIEGERTEDAPPLEAPAPAETPPVVTPAAATVDDPPAVTRPSPKGIQRPGRSRMFTFGRD
jgi:alpha,alpha-trehalase